MDWNEADHPRGTDGKFGSGGAVSKSHESKFVSKDVVVTKKKKFEKTGASDDVTHSLMRAQYHSDRAKMFAEKAKNADNDLDRKKWQAASAVSMKHAIRHANLAEKYAKKSGDPEMMKKASAAKQLAEVAKAHATGTASPKFGKYENHPDNPAFKHPLVGKQVDNGTIEQVHEADKEVVLHTGEVISIKEAKAQAVSAAKPKAEAPKLTSVPLSAPKSKQDAVTTAEKAFNATVAANTSGKAEDHLAAAQAHNEAYEASKNEFHIIAANAHEKIAKYAEQGKYDAAKAKTGTEYYAKGALEQAQEKLLDPSMSEHDYIALSQAHTKALNASEKSSVKNYTGSGYSAINSQLRSGKIHGAVKDTHVPQLDSAIAKSKLPSDMVLYRGMGGSELYKDLDVGDSFEDKGYVSTSAVKGSQFGGAVALEIQASAGHPGLAVRALSGSPHENEVLLPRGSKFEILGKEIKKSAYGNETIHLKVRLLPIEEGKITKAA